MVSIPLLLEGERLLFVSPFAGTLVRLGGIYGPRRTRLIASGHAFRHPTFREGYTAVLAGAD